jgi:hypothetical protein
MENKGGKSWCQLGTEKGNPYHFAVLNEDHDYGIVHNMIILWISSYDSDVDGSH